MVTTAEIVSRTKQLVCDAPFSLTYAAVIIATSSVRLVAPQIGQRLDADLSTNIANLDDHPMRSLLGSALVVDGSAPLNLIFGITPMVVAERRIGPRATAIMFTAGHVGASLITSVTIRRGIRSGYYPPEVATATDIGLSYGALAVRFAAIGALRPGRSQLRDLGRAATLLGVTSPWRMPRDFTATGHVIAAAIGSVGAVALGGSAAKRSPAGGASGSRFQ